MLGAGLLTLPSARPQFSCISLSKGTSDGPVDARRGSPGPAVCATAGLLHQPEPRSTGRPVETLGQPKTHGTPCGHDIRETLRSAECSRRNGRREW